MRKYGKMFGLIAAIVLGVLIPQGAALAFLVRYLVAAMLFCAFVEIVPSLRNLDKSLAWVLAANIAIPAFVYLALRPFDQQLALAGCVTALSPTATAAPVIAGFCGSRVDYVATAVLITNAVIVVLLPFVLSIQNGIDFGVMWTCLCAVAAVVFVPFLAAQLVRWKRPDFVVAIRRNWWLPFGAWLLVLFLATSSASQFIRVSAGSAPLHIVPLALLSLAICATNFGVGYLIGLPKFGREASQSLGQKNTMLMVWFSLSFCSPFAALGPTFYVIYHNLYNSFQMVRRSLAKSQPQEVNDVPSDT